MTSERWEQVGKLYQAALELQSEERKPFLDDACGDDSALRREVESLLAAEDGAGSFLAAGAMKDAAKMLVGEKSLMLVGKNLGHYQLLSLLGAGGMGEVYLAEDTRLKRKVALKLLPAELTANRDRLRRFEQEARAASALNHPNIITIHEIGQVDGLNFIVTELIEGQTLRQQIATGRMKLSAVLDVAVQVASALVAAHAAGIIHRDLKPENIMLRPDGLIKVLDFGLAKLTEPRTTHVHAEAATVARVDTEMGIVMGTAQYMSPEQARGLKVDARTDIFSLGVLIYEMVAGRLPFEGSNTNEILASILSDKEPSPLARYTREVPAELERIVSKALRKDREERYQTIKDLLIDFKGVKQELEFEARLERASQRDAGSDSRPASNGSATKPTTATGDDSLVPPISSARILLGEIKRHQLGVALTLAALVIAAVASFFYFHRQPALTDKDTILLADWVNTTGDAVFDGTLKQALAVQLEQSPFLNIFPQERVRETLRLMSRSPDERVTSAIGQEICQRQGLKALLAGSITSLGRNYVITLEAINAQTGEKLASQQVEAESKEQVLKALGRAASQLREKLGESLASIQKFDAPIEEATTSSLEALKAFSLGQVQSISAKNLEAIPTYKRAIELDPNFAYAYARLATAYVNIQQPALGAQFAERAFELRERASEHEKFGISASYYDLVTGELGKSIEVAEIWKQTYPRDYGAHSTLSLAYRFTGQFEEAIDEAHEAVRLDPNRPYAYVNLGHAFIGLNRFEEAKEIYERALARNLDFRLLHDGLYWVAFIHGDLGAMQQQVDWYAGKPEEYVASNWQARTASFAGRLRSASEFSHRAVDLAEVRDSKELAASFAIEMALREAFVGQCRQTKADTANALAISPNNAIRFGNTETPLLPAGAFALALCGDAGQAQSLADELTKQYPKATLTKSMFLPVIHATIELQRGHSDRAVQLLQAASPYESAARLWPTYLRGQAYLRWQKGAEAAAEFQKILDHRGWDPLSLLHPMAHLGLARAWVLQGDTAKARKAYQDFFALWKDADPDIPILIEAKKEYEKLR
jgi:serine/threonine protein kinase/predicted Zn-dependent protease